MNVITLALYLATSCSGSRILAVIPTPSYNLQMVFQPFWRELSLRGHQITVLATHTQDDQFLTNLTEINLLPVSEDIWESYSNVINSDSLTQADSDKLLTDALAKITHAQLGHPKVQDLIANQSENFDLLIIEFISPNLLLFSQRFNCPYIGLLAVDAPISALHDTGNPVFSGTLTFRDRVVSTLHAILTNYINPWFGLSHYEEIKNKHFGSNYSSLVELSQSVSALLVFSNPLLHEIRPLIPTVVQVGDGSEYKMPQVSIPQDAQTFLDASHESCIYISLDSNKDVSSTFVEIFAELPYKVLWEFGFGSVPNKPPNVLITKRLPRAAILKHPNVKLFVTSGGMQSLYEAIRGRVPIIGIPQRLDQKDNIARIVVKGLGLSIDKSTISKDDLKQKIEEVMHKPVYLDNVQKLVDLLEDTPMSGLERAVWWTEYVLRHNGTEHLRSPLHDIPWYQYWLLDIAIAYLCIIVCFLGVLAKSIAAALTESIL